MNNGAGKKPNTAIENYDKTVFNIDGTRLLRYNGDFPAVKIPYGITEIGDCAFQYAYDNPFADEDREIKRGEGSRNLQKITIPHTVQSIGYETFFDCFELKNIEIPDSIIRIGGKLFSGCNALENVVVESGNPVYHSSENCIIETSSKTLVCGCASSEIPKDGSVTQIAPAAFMGCFLKKAEVPYGVIKIGVEAFAHSGIEWVCVSGSVKIIPKECFYRCHRLTTAEFKEGVEELGDGAFYECESLNSVIFPYGIKRIGERAFYRCENLEEINLPDTIEEIGYAAFFWCGKLTKINIPENLKIIADNTFQRCGLAEVYIPENVKYIGNRAFAGCKNLKKVYLPNSTELGKDAFGFCFKDLQIIRY